MVPIHCSQPLLSIVFLLFVYDLGTLLLTVVVRAFIFLFRCSGFLLPLGGTTTPRSPSHQYIGLIGSFFTIQN